MDLQLAGKRAFVLGGGRGLGRSVAAALVAEGVDVAIVARSEAQLAATALELSKSGPGRAIAVVADLSDWNSLRRAVERASAGLGGHIEILLNNSGGPPASKAVGIAPELWRAHFETMVLSYIRLTDQLLPDMRSAGWGRVINVASTSVVEPLAHLALSNTLRASVIGWAKTLADEVAKDGITVNSLLPGRIATSRIAALDQARSEARAVPIVDIEKAAVAAIPIGRSGRPEEFGAVAAFIASPVASYITGSTIRIDGGVMRSV